MKRLRTDHVLHDRCDGANTNLMIICRYILSVQLTNIPGAQIGSELMAIDSEAMKARGIIVLVKSN